MPVFPAIRRNFVEGIRAVENVLFPPRCWLCDSWETQPPWPICSSCMSQMEEILRPRCSICSLPLPHADADCPDCCHWPEPQIVIHAPYRFEGAIRRLIHRAKFQGATELVPVATRLMLPFALKWYGTDERWLLVPVPSYGRALWERGYSVPALLARFLARDMRRSVLLTTLVKTADTPPQRELKASRRRENPAGTFAVSRRRDIEGRRILLIDDVATSCATIHHCAAALLENGAERVEALVLARSIR